VKREGERVKNRKRGRESEKRERVKNRKRGRESEKEKERERE
jgi:hypothetical protein